MKKEMLVILADYSEESFITLQELYETYHISSDDINELIEYEIIHPQDQANQLSFTLNELHRIKMAMRLQHDLEVNPQGIAIIIDLLERLEDLRVKNELLEKHLLK